MEPTQFPQFYQYLINNPTNENIKYFKHFIKEKSSLICGLKQESITLSSIFTIIGHLNTRNDIDLIQTLIEAANEVLSISYLETEISVRTMLVILLNYYNFQSSRCNISEQLKLCTLTCFETIFRRAKSEVVEQFYIKDNLGLLAQVLSVNEVILSQEANLPLRLAAIKCIMSTFQVHDQSDNFNVKLRKHVANVTFIVIPKIVGALTLIAIDDTCNDILKTNSIRALGRIVHLIFEDIEDGISLKNQTTSLVLNTLISSSAAATPQNAMDDGANKWFENSAVKLIMIFQKLKGLAFSTSISIRRELYISSSILLKRCQRHLAVCLPILIEINTALCNEYDDQYLFYDEYMIDVVEELFIAHMICLPRIINTGSDGEQAASFTKLQNFIFLLDKGKRLKITLSDSRTSEQLVRILLLAVELKLDNKLIEIGSNNSTNRDVFNGMYLYRTNAPWKNFKNLRNYRFVENIHQICACLAKQHDISVIILEYLNSTLLKNSIFSNESLILIQMFLEISCEKTTFMHVTILQNLLTDVRWKLATKPMEEINFIVNCNFGPENYYAGSVQQYSKTNNIVPLKELKNNILHTCLVIETVGCYAKYMKHCYKIFLIKSIQYLIEKSASVEYMIQASALRALENVKDSLGLQTIPDLIITNADYISNAINTLLIKHNSTNSGLQTLISTLQLGSSKTPFYVDIDSIVPVLIAESTKWSQSRNILSFLFVFKLILLNIRKQTLESTAEIVTKDEKCGNDNQINLNHFLYWSNILNADTMGMEYKSNEQINEEAAKLPDHDRITSYTNLTVLILKHIISYVTSKNTKVKLISLESIIIGLDLIKENENELLPLVNQLWNIIAQQCARSNKNYTRYFIVLITKLAVYTKNFASKQTTCQIVLHLCQYCHELTNKYADQKQILLDKHSIELRMLKELVNSITDILYSLNIQERELNDFLRAATFLLDNKQLSQMYNIDLYEKIGSFDICSVFLNKNTN